MVNHLSITRTNSGEVDRRVVVRHPLPLARTISDGGNWTKIRIGMRISTRREVNWINAPWMYFGLSSGVDALPGTASPNHFFGIRTNIREWEKETASPYITAGVNSCLIVNGVETGAEFGGNSNTISSPRFNFTTGTLPALWALDITKGSPYSMTTYWSGDSLVPQTSLSAFKEFMDQTVPSGYITNTPPALTPNEATNGVLDTVCFAWTGYDEAHAFEISDIKYKVIS